MPTGHGACDDDPAGQANPAAHKLVQAGDVSPVVLPYRPGGHMIGVDELEVMPAAQYRPTVAVQAAPAHAPLMGAPVVEVLPGGHKVAKVATKLPAERLKAIVRFTAGTSAHGGIREWDGKCPNRTRNHASTKGYGMIRSSCREVTSRGNNLGRTVFENHGV